MSEQGEHPAEVTAVTAEARMSSSTDEVLAQSGSGTEATNNESGSTECNTTAGMIEERDVGITGADEQMDARDGDASPAAASAGGAVPSCPVHLARTSDSRSPSPDIDVARSPSPDIQGPSPCPLIPRNCLHANALGHQRFLLMPSGCVSHACQPPLSPLVTRNRQQAHAPATNIPSSAAHARAGRICSGERSVLS
jgi:hypothetical protein